MLSFCELRHFLLQHETVLDDPLQSVLILNLLRGLPVENHDIESFKAAGWVKEISLGWNARAPEVNFHPFFFLSKDPIHKEIPYNLTSLLRVRNAFRAFC